MHHNEQFPCIANLTFFLVRISPPVTTDEAWEIVFAQANQAADDLGIDLKLDRLAPQPSSEVLHSKMATKIVSLCNEGVDGLFVSIPSDSVAAAIKACQSLNVPVISVNSGAQLAMDLGLTHHISQVEYSAGFEAGKSTYSLCNIQS